MRGVVARQMSVRLCVTQIVDRHDLDLILQVALIQRTQHVAADAPISIDAHFDCHRNSNPLIKPTRYFVNTVSIAAITRSAVNP
jgi:hypothetical protein